ncbi:MAG: NUDIX hydrolase [Chloroflexi bacterium]|nr:NUDIX hydrolase [Chloroflexota bacterium]
MRVKRREPAFEGDHLRLVRKHFETDSGQEGVWETVEMVNTYERGAVVIIALTKQREVILERNWRVPLECGVIQFPAGLTDRKGESEEETARRELLEETGYLAKELIPIAALPLVPELSPIEAVHFFAPDVEFVGKSSEDTDPIKSEVITVPLERLGHFLMNLPENTRLDLRVPGILWLLERGALLSGGG